MLVSYHNTGRYDNREKRDMTPYRREKLKTEIGTGSLINSQQSCVKCEIVITKK